MFLLIFIPIAILIGFIILAFVERDSANVTLGFLASVCAACLLALVTCIVGAVFIPDNEITYAEKVTPIVALQDNCGASGAFFLGTGSVKDTMYYYYMTEQEDGYKMGKTSTEMAYVRYDSEPRIVEHVGDGFKHWYNYIWALPCRTTTTIYVPEDTIQTNFNINLQ